LRVIRHSFALFTSYAFQVVNRLLGLWVVVGGVCLILIGVLIYSGGFNWFGKLPGDIRYESDRTAVYIPLVSMLIVSLALSLIFYILRKFF
jgi:uncharacterized membrane protein YidH (DUF202 family)